MAAKPARPWSAANYGVRDDASLGVWAKAIRDKDFGIIADWFTAYFFSTGIIALLVVGFAAGLEAPSLIGGFGFAFRIFALGLLVAGAATVCGWLLGLLFGIPRSLALAGGPQANGSTTTVTASASSPSSSTATAAPMRSTSSRVNTNLEDISDWLTKTIVGVGLTQFYALPKFLGDLAHDTNVYGFGWPAHGQLLALCLLLYFAPGGFWLGYVGTRTILTALFDMFSSDFSLSEKKLREAADVEVTKDGIAPPDRAQRETDATLLATPLRDLNTAPQFMAWAGAQARARNFDSASVALRNVLADDPDNSEARRQLYAVHSGELFSALYEPSPGGFEKAIAIGEKLLGDPQAAADSNLHVWLASAYAQRYGYRKTKGATDSELQALKENVLVEIRAAIAIDPSERERLYAFWHPDPGSLDDDLSWFASDDPDLTALLNPPAMAQGGA